MKTFQHEFIELPSLTRIDGDIRMYETPTGEKYPSVTTVLSAMSDKTALNAWRKRVGEDFANKRTKQAANRGTIVHKLCEEYVFNREVDMSAEMPINKMMYQQLERVLDQNVDNIMVSEGMLYSHKLKIAGSVDLIARWKGKKATIDFKTSFKRKRKEWIENYFMQASMYSFMLWEMTGIACPTIVILIAVEEENECQVFEDSASNWIDKARDMCERYHAFLG